MSEQFYSYLSSKIITYFRNNQLKPGDKFYVQFESDAQVEKLYKELNKNIISKPFAYFDALRNETYETYELEFEKVKLLVASTYGNVHPDFLATLRNYVGVEQGYQNKAIFFIHCSTLDSILGGSGSFHKEGMPFSIKSIEQDIKIILDKSSFNYVDKEILKMYLQNKRNGLVGGNPSVFEYEDILSIIQGSNIGLNDYGRFGLFPDNKLDGVEGNKLKQRLEDNAMNYSRVAEIHNYGLSDLMLEKYYDEKGVEKLKKEDWVNTLYSDVEKYIYDKKNRTVIEYIPNIDSNKYWDREEGSSKAKSRIRNIIVFQEENQNMVELEFSFTEYVRTEYINFDSSSVKCATSGKKIVAQLSNINDNATFYEIKYKTDEATFDFRIVVLKCEKYYIESIRTIYSVVIKNKISESSLLINSDERELIFNEFGESEKHISIKDTNQLVYIEKDKTIIDISEQYPYSDDSDTVKFRICVEDSVIPISKVAASEKPKVIEGMKLWKLKRDYKTNFEYLGENKLQHGTRPYFTRDEFRKNLELEKDFINKGELALFDNSDEYVSMNLQIDKEIVDAYSQIIRYFRNNKCLPSLTYINEELSKLYEDFIISIVGFLETINDGDYLKAAQKDIFYIGMIKRNKDDREIMLTPLHPLNIAYQLHVARVDTTCIDDNEMELLRKFQHLYLLPYININPHTKEPVVYIPIEQSHSAEWKVYVEELLPRYKGSKDYVSKLVSEKIEEFTDYFSYLFEIGNKAPIKINLINTGDSNEILQGIFKYYVKKLRSSKIRKIVPMRINVYSNSNITNVFEEFASIDDVSIIKEMFNLDLNVDDMNEDEVIDLYRENVYFYSKKDINNLEYAHITFMEMLDDSQIISTAMEDIPSGVAMNGIISGTPSVLLADTYRTGFGTKFTNKESRLMQMAIKFNSINAAINGNQYRENTCSAVTIPKKNQNDLDKIYDASNWVTFINPKVDLSYFKNDPNAKDLIIIHYSDQYNTTSSGYDAITVTRKSKQYQNVIEDYLCKHGVNETNVKSPNIINMFNAINGDWLLRLLSSKSYFPKEKLSILSAIKLAIKRFTCKDIIWIPISLEEVLRVSGGIGLRQKDSLFSTKNLGFENGGATSDDILLIGIKNSDMVEVTFYPIEVKIGKNESNYINKGITQALHTKDIFMKTLGIGNARDANYKTRLYRNFFMQLALTSTEKLLLYEVGDGNQGWNIVTDSDLRRKLLNEEYVIVDSFIHQMGKAAVLSFKADSVSEKEFCYNGVLLIEKTEQDGINLLTQDIAEIETIEWDNLKTMSHLEKINNDVNQLDNKVEAALSCENINSNDEIIEDENSYNGQQDVEDEILVERSNRNMEILFGTKQDVDKPLIWYPNDSSKVFHSNTGIIGTMGTGKTQFTKSLITQIHRETKYNLDSKDIGILIFDYKGDYNKTKPEFIEATGANVYSLCDLPFNPLSLTLTENPKPRLPLHIANSLKETISKAFGLGIKQETLLRELIMDAYESKGISKTNESTWSRQAPTLQDVFDLYVNREDLKEDSLYAAFSNLIDFEIFEPEGANTKGLFELINGVTVIDLSGFDTGIQNLVVAITLDLFYLQMQAYGHSEIRGDIRQLNKIILVDEADNFLSKNFSSLKKILKEGREFGVGTILSTQLLSHFSTGDNEYANYILTWVIHNVADLNMKDIKYIFNTQNKSEEEYLFNKIKRLKKHYSVVKMGDSNNAINMRDKAFWELDKEMI